MQNLLSLIVLFVLAFVGFVKDSCYLYASCSFKNP